MMKTFFRTTKTFILFCSLLSWGILGVVHIPQESIEHFSQHLEGESRQEWEYLGRVGSLSSSTLDSLIQILEGVRRISNEDPNREREFSRRLRELRKLRMAVTPEDSPLTERYLEEVIGELRTILYGMLAEDGSFFSSASIFHRRYKEKPETFVFF